MPRPTASVPSWMPRDIVLEDGPDGTTLEATLAGQAATACGLGISSSICHGRAPPETLS
jgi:hypothetical protein